MQPKHESHLESEILRKLWDFAELVAAQNWLRYQTPKEANMHEGRDDWITAYDLVWRPQLKSARLC